MDTLPRLSPCRSYDGRISTQDWKALLRAVACAVLCLGCVLYGAAGHARPVDDALIDEFESADGREQLEVARRILERLGDGRPTAIQAQRLVDLIGSSQALAKYGQTAALVRALGPASQLPEPATVAAARGLNSDTVHTSGSAAALGQLLTEYDDSHQLPDAAMTELYSALARPAGANVIGALGVLETMKVNDRRFERNAASIVQVLEVHERRYVRRQAVAALARYGAQTPLPEIAVNALSNTATTDDYMTVRLDAYEALTSAPGIDRAALGRKLAAELVNPSPDLWERSSGTHGHHEVIPRAVELLADWFAAFYPGYVVDAFIAQAIRYDPPSLAHLRKVRRMTGFSPTQRLALESVAERHQQNETRQALYELAAEVADTDPGSEPVDDLATIEGRGDVASRIKAAYRIEQRYGGQSVPRSVAAIAQRLVLTDKSNELREIAARLIANSDDDFEIRERKLIEALETHDNDYGIYLAWQGLYGTDRLEEFVMRYAAQASLPVWARVHAVRQLKTLAEPGRHLREGTYKSLVAAASTSRRYDLNSAVSSTLLAWGADIPWSVKVRNKTFQGKALFVAYCCLALLFIAASLAALIASLVTPIDNPRRTAKRAGLFLLWLLLSLAGLALFALAFVGFLGHNSAPAPSWTLSLNVPMYAGMVVFLIYTWLTVRWARRNRRR